MNIIDKLNRTPWDIVYMSMAFHLAANRSLDPRTKHGCFIVADDYSPLSFGYNSPPQGCNDDNIPLDAPAKYDYFAHAEQNAIDNAAEHGFSLKNSIFYITGFPCPRCFQSIRRVKAQKIIYGPVGSHMITQKDINAVKLMNTNKDGHDIIKIIKFSENFENEMSALESIKKSQEITWDYINKKCLGK